MLVRRLAADGLQPGSFPEDQAPRLAPAVRRAIAARLQMHRTIQPASANRKHRIASLVSPLVNWKPPAAKREHFGHKWHPLELPVGVQRSEDFFFASDFYPVAGAQFTRHLHRLPMR